MKALANSLLVGFLLVRQLSKKRNGIHSDVLHHENVWAKDADLITHPVPFQIRPIWCMHRFSNHLDFIRSMSRKIFNGDEIGHLLFVRAVQ